MSLGPLTERFKKHRVSLTGDERRLGQRSRMSPEPARGRCAPQVGGGRAADLREPSRSEDVDVADMGATSTDTPALPIIGAAGCRRSFFAC